MMARLDDNRAGMSVLWGELSRPGAEEVRVMPFDQLIDEVTAAGVRRIKLLKIDCEASEFPILLTSRKLCLIDAICGEFHEMGGPYDTIPIPERFRVDGINQFSMSLLEERFAQEGFIVHSERYGNSNMGLFFAARAPIAVAGTH
jgi:hypothetical protein